MPQNSFDIVSQVEMPEVLNAVNQAIKEIHNRYDLKSTKSSIELNQDEHKIVLASDDDFKLKAVTDVLELKLIKRKVPVKALTYGEIQEAAGSSVRQEVSLQNGIPVEKARAMVKAIKQAKLKKVQASIQGDLVRVTGKNRDDLQEVMKLLKEENFGIDFQFTNYRTN
jgi:cyclic-di-GMP-binding protein